MQNQASIYDFTMKGIDGKDVTLSKFKGKKMLLVNVASECGYTPQYEGLQKLSEEYADRVTVLGFPANNFGAQEPGSDDEISSFCRRNYGVTFPVFSKISVVGHDRHPLYTWLSSKALNGWNSKAPDWNFCKYLVSEEGRLLKFYSAAVKPLSRDILSEL